MVLTIQCQLLRFTNGVTREPIAKLVDNNAVDKSYF